MYNIQLTESYFPAQADTEYKDRTIAAILDDQAKIRGGQDALREVMPDGSIGRTWTYETLKSDAEKLGRALAARHASGARVAVFAHNIPEWVLLELGAVLAGLTLVTVNPSFTHRELAYVLEQSGSEAIYFVDNVRGTPLAPIVEAATKSLSKVKHKILLTDHDALFSGSDAGELRPTMPAHNAQIQYTSGTTGFPKGVLLHQQGLIQNASDTAGRWGVKPGASLLAIMPLFHTSGCGVTILGGLSHGCTLFMPSGFDPVMIVKLIERENIEYFGGVATMLVAMLEVAEQKNVKIKSVNTIMSGGAMVAPELVRKAKEIFGAPIQIVYGQTETSPCMTYTWPDDSDEDLSGTIGQPLPHLELSIRNVSDNSVCAIDVQGEICCRGYNVMSGYNDNPEATAATIDADGWLHTGDLGTMDSRGYVKITGRVKEMIIRGGENLFPVEIENAILEHNDIAEAAVVGIPDDKWGEQVACFMRAAGVARPEPTELKAYIRNKLSPQKTPTFWIWVEDWPLTGSGKIQKFALRDGFVAGDYQ
jgi:fatty-acyl-CoA synthase